MPDGQKRRGRPPKIDGKCDVESCDWEAVRTIRQPNTSRLKVCERDYWRLYRRSALPCSWPKCQLRRQWNKNDKKHPGYCREHERDFLLTHPLLHQRLEYVANNIVHRDGCWHWLKDPQDDRSTWKRPRGKVRLGYDWLPYRFVYVATVGVIPAHLVLDHLCGLNTCILPTHLEPVTPAENNRRKTQRARGQRDRRTEIARRTHQLMNDDEADLTSESIANFARRIYPRDDAFVLAHRMATNYEPQPSNA